MKSFLFKGLLTNDGWISNAEVQVDHAGIINSIQADSHDSLANKVNGYAIPGFQNAHSHAFQYAMAGLSERHDGSGKPDDFWSWRSAMYHLALSINPDEIEAIASMLYAEMVRHGYTHVAEFHYVHHDKNGKPYSDLSETGSRLIAAAQKVGIKITLIPVFYQKGGFGEAPSEKQRRFICSDIDTYMKLYESSKKATSTYHGANIALGAHSLRGVEPELVKKICAETDHNIPFHIHISEQLKEVKYSLQYLKKRPVEWMLENVDMGSRFHLVHATHLTKSETIGIAQSKANVVLCPSTEGNLGDGIFPLNLFQKSGGQWSIGTDSHVGLNPLEELRILDYGQRLTTHKRNSFYSPNQTDSGTFAIDMALKTGRMAMGHNHSDYFKIGLPLDAVVYDSDSPLLACTSLDNLCSTLVYSTDAHMHLGTMINGNWVVKKGEKEILPEITDKFVSVIRTLQSR